MNKEILKLVIYEQRAQNTDLGVIRPIDRQLLDCPEILVITGLRRCGKSVLLRQIQDRMSEKDYYINFDDERLINFTVEDFQMLTEVFMEEFGLQKTYYLDEIQNIVGWERFVSRLYGQGCKVFVTGSNAHLLSRELGTFLTGRHVTKELFPFSFSEYLELQHYTVNKTELHTTQGKIAIFEQVDKYLKTGGLPQYILFPNDNYLISLYHDILYKDVIVRNRITNEKPIKEMLYYLASNATHRYTYNSVSKIINLKSSDTVKSYLDYLEATYLIQQLNKFDYSLGVQLKSPKKIYFIDNAFIGKIGFNATENVGNLLENAVFIELSRRGKNLFYHSNGHECDFIIRQGVKIVEAIQVTLSIQNDRTTREREIQGLISAMETYQLKEGTIITLNENEEIETTAKQHIHVISLVNWLLNLV